MARVSIVIASHNGGANVFRCLRSLEHLFQQTQAEIIVVDSSNDGTAEAITRAFPQIRSISVAKQKLIPQLWEIGIQASSGDIVAITTGDFIPQEDWVEQILKAHDGPYAGVGGAIETGKDSGVVSSAIHLCRYSAYMLPLKKSSVNDFAADNASYKRSALDNYAALRRNGFWESPIHAQMVRDGLQLLLTPDIVVQHQQSFSFWGFMKQRFLHGRQYGADRAKDFSMIRRQFYIFMSPLIPLIFLWRITRRVIARKRNLGQYMSALPVLVMFLISWSAGELVGYLSTPLEKGFRRQLADRQV